MIRFSLILNDLVAKDKIILSQNLVSPCLPRREDNLVYNGTKYTVERVIFDFNDNSCSILVMVKLADIELTAKNKKEEDYSILSIIM